MKLLIQMWSCMGNQTTGTHSSAHRKGESITETQSTSPEDHFRLQVPPQGRGRSTMSFARDGCAKSQLPSRNSSNILELQDGRPTPLKRCANFRAIHLGKKFLESGCLSRRVTEAWLFGHSFRLKHYAAFLAQQS